MNKFPIYVIQIKTTTYLTSKMVGTASNGIKREKSFKSKKNKMGRYYVKNIYIFIIKIYELLLHSPKICNETTGIFKQSNMSNL